MTRKRGVSPIFSDFGEIYSNEAEVRLTFIPTQTEIWFDRNQQTGGLLETIHIWHRTVSGFGHFVEKEVVTMARKIAEESGAAYLVFCPARAEFGSYAEGNPDGLAATMLAGRVPDWLEPVPLTAEPPFKVYRIR